MVRTRRDSKGRRDVVAVGLTGGIGAGKSTALALFAELGALTLSADRLVHELYERPWIVARIGEHFGPEVVDEQRRKVDRARLAEAVKGRPDELHWLEDLTHPRVSREIRRRIEKASRGTVVVCEVPLLFESGLEGLFDLVVTVEADEAVRRVRSVHGFGLKQFSEFEDRQYRSRQRIEGSDLVVRNNGEITDLREAVRAAYEIAVSLLGERVKASED